MLKIINRASIIIQTDPDYYENIYDNAVKNKTYSRFNYLKKLKLQVK